MADFYLAPYVYNYERAQVVDFPYLISSEASVAILSSPRVMINQNMFSLITYFDKWIWILMLLSYVTIVSINSYSLNEWKYRLNLAIDYAIICLGKGSNHIIISNYS